MIVIDVASSKPYKFVFWYVGYFSSKIRPIGQTIHDRSRGYYLKTLPIRILVCSILFDLNRSDEYSLQQCIIN